MLKATAAGDTRELLMPSHKPVEGTLHHFYVANSQTWGLPCGSDSNQSARNAGDPGLIPGWGKIAWRRARQPTPVLLPGESPRTEEPGRATVHGVTQGWTQLTD